MSQVKISALPPATDSDGAEFAGIQGGTTKRFPATTLKKEYMLPIWAEQSGDLLSEGTPIGYEWSFGNGGQPQSNEGLRIYVPSGYECHILAVTLQVGLAMTASVQCDVSGSLIAATTVSIASATDAETVLGTPHQIVNGDSINFYTISATGTGTTPHVVCAWLRYREL